MATHSSILAWKIPRTEETGGLQSMGLQRIGHNWATNSSLHFGLVWGVSLDWVWTGWSLNPVRTPDILVAMRVTSFHSSLSMYFKNACVCYSGPGHSGWPTKTLTGTEGSGKVNMWARILHCQTPSQLKRSFMPLLIHGYPVPSVLLWPPQPNFQLFRKPQLPRLPEHADFWRSQACYMRERLLGSSHLGPSQFTKNLICAHI